MPARVRSSITCFAVALLVVVLTNHYITTQQYDALQMPCQDSGKESLLLWEAFRTVFHLKRNAGSLQLVDEP